MPFVFSAAAFAGQASFCERRKSVGVSENTASAAVRNKESVYPVKKYTGQNGRYEIFDPQVKR